MRGLDPRIHLLGENNLGKDPIVAKKMDPRVKPADDNSSDQQHCSLRPSRSTTSRTSDRLNPQVPLFAAGVALGVTVAILVAVCMWPSQRLAKGEAMSNWSSTRATMWLTMSSTVCGWL